MQSASTSGCFLAASDGRARALKLVSPLQRFRQRVANIPVYGSIPAGFADDRRQEAKGCVSIDIETLGLKPTPRTFALEVRGDSMIGKCIMDGDCKRRCRGAIKTGQHCAIKSGLILKTSPWRLPSSSQLSFSAMLQRRIRLCGDAT